MAETCEKDVQDVAERAKERFIALQAITSHLGGGGADGKHLRNAFPGRAQAGGLGRVSPGALRECGVVVEAKRFGDP